MLLALPSDTFGPVMLVLRFLQTKSAQRVKPIAAQRRHIMGKRLLVILAPPHFSWLL